MSTEKIEQQLERLRTRRAFGKFVRSIPGCEVLHGYVIGQSNSLVLLHVVREFHLDGYSLIRMKDLEKVQVRREEKFFDKMLKSEGVTQHVGLRGKFPFSRMPIALRRLSEMEALVSVECEASNEESFFAGRIITADAKKVILETFDPLGQWSPEPEEVASSAVTLVSWETEYLKVFSKYLHD